MLSTMTGRDGTLQNSFTMSYKRVPMRWSGLGDDIMPPAASSRGRPHAFCPASPACCRSPRIRPACGPHPSSRQHCRLTTPSHSAVRPVHVAFENLPRCFVTIQRRLQRHHTKTHRSATCVPFAEGPTQHRWARPSSDRRD